MKTILNKNMILKSKQTISGAKIRDCYAQMATNENIKLDNKIKAIFLENKSINSNVCVRAEKFKKHSKLILNE